MFLKHPMGSSQVLRDILNFNPTKTKRLKLAFFFRNVWWWASCVELKFKISRKTCKLPIWSCIIILNNNNFNYPLHTSNLVVLDCLEFETDCKGEYC